MIHRIKDQKILPIIRHFSEHEAFFLVECFQQVGFHVFEVSLNQPNSYTVLELLNKKYGSEMVIGAGTVLTKEDAQRALDCGASFYLSPNVSKEVSDKAKELGIPYIPGALTPTELQYAHELGAPLIKLFPVRQLGISYIKDILATLNRIGLLGVGGVNLDNVKRLLQVGLQGVGIGSSLVEKEWIENRDEGKVIQRLNEYKQLIQ